jgi:hypothetical protein
MLQAQWGGKTNFFFHLTYEITMVYLNWYEEKKKNAFIQLCKWPPLNFINNINKSNSGFGPFFLY